MKRENLTDKKTMGYKCGEAIGIVISACIIACLIAITARLIWWILFKF